MIFVISDPYRTYAGLDRGQAVTVTRTDWGALFVQLAS